MTSVTVTVVPSVVRPDDGVTLEDIRRCPPPNPAWGWRHYPHSAKGGPHDPPNAVVEAMIVAQHRRDLLAGAS